VEEEIIISTPGGEVATSESFDRRYRVGNSRVAKARHCGFYLGNETGERIDGNPLLAVGQLEIGPSVKP
jgi:hypothetical protein